MNKAFLPRILLLTCLPAGASAQWMANVIQNTDMQFAAGPIFTKTQTIGGANVTVYGSCGLSTDLNLGFKVMRKTNVNLWVEYSDVSTYPHAQTGAIPGSTRLGGLMGLFGLRLMLPVQSRVSALASAGGGFGFFSQPGLTSDNPPKLASDGAAHGVFDVAAGIDCRLSQFFSIRLQVVDYITGRDLDGIPGRNHLLPLFGLVFHGK